VTSIFNAHYGYLFGVTAGGVMVGNASLLDGGVLYLCVEIVNMLFETLAIEEAGQQTGKFEQDSITELGIALIELLCETSQLFVEGAVLFTAIGNEQCLHRFFDCF
jgi:hypothetical protein